MVEDRDLPRPAYERWGGYVLLAAVIGAGCIDLMFLRIAAIVGLLSIAISFGEMRGARTERLWQRVREARAAAPTTNGGGDV